MKKLLLLFIALFWFTNVKAQYVTIPDAKFAAYLQSVIPSAMNGNQMDTTSPAVTSLTRIVVENDSIGDLTGVQYFDSLKILDCGNFPSSLTPANFVTSLPKLPSTLDTLICGGNQITSLPTLPNTLNLLKCYGNPLHNLPALSSSLQYLDCSNDSLTSLPSLPSSLVYLYCSSNQLINLPSLPNLISAIDCSSNQLVSIPALPDSLKTLYIENNQLSNLPSLPTSFLELYCWNNMLTNLPSLPNTMYALLCSANQLTSLPALPNSLGWLDCNYNQLTSLPTLPNQLTYLVCESNKITCFPVFPTTLSPSSFNFGFSIQYNPFTCLPNYVAGMNAATLAYPLCSAGNTNSCPNAQGVLGYTYKDINSNCMRNSGDTSLKNIPVLLYDTANNLLGQTYSALNGVYDFPQTMGTYTVVIDTFGSVPYKAQCNNLSLDTTVTVANIDTNVNFSLTCKPGFDVGVLSTVANGLVFPGQQFALNTIAGDISQWYNLNCAAGVSGQVQITVTGPVTFVGPAGSALTPTISGNVYTYNIADFALVNIQSAFNMLFSVDNSSQAGDLVCVNITVTPTGGDNNVSNNNYAFCFSVVNSHDPNRKETYPVNVAPGYNDWFTYTIHFQNTGNAPALNIRLVDTLDANLDLNTFQTINYSNKNTASVRGNVLMFNFSNINLPDSTSNPTGSIGFVQYRVKPKANLPNGTQIKNTANIYFDFNVPIVTNTTINTYTTTAGISYVRGADNQVSVYPNPGNGMFSITTAEHAKTILVTDVLGNEVLSVNPSATTTTINLGAQPNGIYFVKVLGNNTQTVKRIIINK